MCFVQTVLVALLDKLICMSASLPANDHCTGWPRADSPPYLRSLTPSHYWHYLRVRLGIVEASFASRADIAPES
jgi:hypothetical protein